MKAILINPQGLPLSPDSGFAGGIQRLCNNIAVGLSAIDVSVEMITTEYFATGVTSSSGNLKLCSKPDATELANGYKLHLVPPGYDLFRYVSKLRGNESTAFVLVIDNGGPFRRPSMDELIELVHKLKEKCPVLLMIPFPRTEIDFYFAERNVQFIDKIRTLSSLSNATIFPSMHCSRQYSDLAQGHTEIVYPGTLLPNRKSALDVDTISCVSRFGVWAIHKNHIPLLEALQSVVRERSNVKCHFIGTDTRVLMSMVNRLGLTQNVVIHDQVSEDLKSSLLSRTGLFVLPSAIEAYGFSFAEALSFGIPVIGCARTAVEEIGRSAGLFCRPTNPSRFAKSWGFSENIMIEPEPLDIAENILNALCSVDELSRKVERPLSIEESSLKLMAILDSYAC